MLHLEEKLFIDSLVWSEEVQEPLLHLQEQTGPAALSGLANSSWRLDVSRGGNKMQRDNSEDILLEKSVTGKRSESGSPIPAKSCDHLTNEHSQGRETEYCHHTPTKHLPLCYPGFILRA